MQLIIALAVAVSAISLVKAECPGGCSGHGMCGAKDMCTCYRNWKGNDCADRICPYAHAFVTSPQGDLNFDGDQFDNSGKYIVDDETGLNAVVDISVNSATMTFSSSNPAASAFASSGITGVGSVDEVLVSELVVGDKIKVADEVFTISAIVTQGKTYTLDHKRLTAVSNKPVVKFLSTQSNPRGDWEQWVGDFSELGDEGHYYMECANRGICDRKSGECKCFEGYSGAACQVNACPAECNYKGTCETISSLASLQPATLQVTGSANALGADPDLVTLNGTAPATLSATGGDTLIIQGTSYTTKTVSGITIRLTTPVRQSFVYGTSISQVMNYQLWDAAQGRSCNCDSRYTGMDCSKKKCHLGDDPLTTAGADPQCESTRRTTAGYSPYTQSNEKQTVDIDSPDGQVIGNFQISFTDEFGKKHTTAPITANPLVSAKCKVTAGTLTKITWDAGYRPACGSLQKDDYIQVDDEIARVVKRTVILGSSSDFNGQCELSDVTVDITLTATTAIESTGFPCYRINADKEIKEALEALPNDVVKGVTVRHIQRSGTLISKAAMENEQATPPIIQFVKDDLTAVQTPSGYGQVIGKGTILRYKDALRVVTEDANNGKYKLPSNMGMAAAARGTTLPPASPNLANDKPVLIYAQNGFTYEVTFESGCTSDDDCRSNGISIRGGVDLTLSDNAWTTDVYDGAVCHPAGYCVCSNIDNFFGPGCTGDGRGSAKRSMVLSNSGDIPDLEFDCSDLSAAMYVGLATVTQEKPNKVSWTAIATEVTVGSMISINGQKRNVIKVASNDAFVDRAFSANSISDSTNVFTKTAVYVVKHSTVTCGSTDQPIVKTSDRNGHIFDWATSATKTITVGTAAGANAEINAFIRDPSTINIGDRVLIKHSTTDNQIRTIDSFTGAGNAITAFTVGEMITDCAGVARSSALADVAVYKVSKGTTEAIECSRRGLCNEDSGTCECFNGYTSYNCDTQNALAM